MYGASMAQPTGIDWAAIGKHITVNKTDDIDKLPIIFFIFIPLPLREFRQLRFMHFIEEQAMATTLYFVGSNLELAGN